MADWEEALNRQIETWSFVVSELGGSYMDGYQRSLMPTLPWRLQHQLASTLWNADPVYVTKDMTALLEAAWPTFEPEVVREEDVFIPSGFAFLHHSLTNHEANEEHFVNYYRAIAWHPVDSGAMFVSIWTTADDAATSMLARHEDDSADRARWVLGQSMALVFAAVVPYGKTVDEIVEEHDRHSTRAELDPQPDPANASRGALILLQCLWRLMGQQVAIGIKQRPSRAQRRRLEREKSPEKYITVITLRRPRQQPAAENGERDVEWSQRWIVSGHWRWQPYKDEVRQIWISPYVKGPADKPLVVRGARVFRLAR